MHEVLEGRDGYDLIFQELGEKTFDLISSLYKSLNNYGFLCLAVKKIGQMYLRLFYQAKTWKYLTDKKKIDTFIMMVLSFTSYMYEVI